MSLFQRHQTILLADRLLILIRLSREQPGLNDMIATPDTTPTLFGVALEGLREALIKNRLMMYVFNLVLRV